MNALVIIQARSSSKRLPGKVVAKASGKEMILHLVGRVAKSKLISGLIVATTLDSTDDSLVELLEKENIPFFRGELEDVLSRFAAVGEQKQPTHIVRITGDCPLVDSSIIDLAVQTAVLEKYDYVSTDSSYPDGFDVEVFTLSALVEANLRATEPFDREHVTPYIKRNSQKIKYLTINPSCEHIRVTLDEPEDLVLIKNIIDHFGADSGFEMVDVVKYLESNPRLMETNSHFVRNEGSRLTTNQKLWKRAERVIPTGNHLLSKNPNMHLPNQWPNFFKKAKGSIIWDIEDREFLDMSLMGVGTNTLGYGNNYVDSKVQAAISLGNMSTLNSFEEVELAEKLLSMHQNFQMARFARTGGEANAIAIRLARAATGKEIVAVCGYHGWHDWYLAGNIASKDGLNSHLLPGLETRGVPDALNGTTTTFHYGDTNEFLSAISDQNTAAVIMEVSRSSKPDVNFLKLVRDETSRRGIVLVFDECSSGFRENFGSMHLTLGVNPDLVMLGKALGNGYAITAVLGLESIMKEAERTFISSTFWTERIGFTAALATLEEMEREKSWEKISSFGKEVQSSWEDVAKSSGVPIRIGGYPAISSFVFENPNHQILKTYITQEMLKKGILAGNMIYASTTHTPEMLSKYLDQLTLIFSNIASAIENDKVEELLDGEVSRSGFGRLN
jgi:glutamate-1-semialdehyde 2,1-aminomutase